MRIIFFNIWHGGIWNKLNKFIEDQSTKTDIFCFLETDQDLQTKIQKLLPDFACFFHPGIKTDYLGGVREGRSIFVSNKISIEKRDKLELFKTSKRDAGGMLYTELKINEKKLFIGSVHGKARPGTKLDTPIRINQSKTITKQFKNIDGPKIIGGDFNLNPDTKSIKMFEESGYINLIKKFSIKSTRNRISWEQFGGSPGFTKQYFADYCFVSPEIKVKNFEVPNIEASDHEPLILDFEIE